MEVCETSAARDVSWLTLSERAANLNRMRPLPRIELIDYSLVPDRDMREGRAEQPGWDRTLSASHLRGMVVVLSKPATR